MAVLLGIAVLFTFPAVDRPALALAEIMIVGLGFIIYGSTMAIEKALGAVDERLYVRRGLFRRRIVSPQVLNSIYLIAVLCGFLRAFVQPRKTWPALAWILAGFVLAGVVVAAASL